MHLAENLSNEKIYQHPHYIGDKTKLDDGSSTLLEMFASVAKNHGKNDFLGSIDLSIKKIEYETYEDVFKKVKIVGRELRLLIKELVEADKNQIETEKIRKEESSYYNEDKIQNGAKEAQNEAKKNQSVHNIKEIIGIFSANRADWIVSEYGIYQSNSTNCPLYSTFGADSIKHILEETELRICFVSGEKASFLFDIINSNNTFNHKLKIIISYDELPIELEKDFIKKGIKVLYMKNFYNKKLVDEVIDKNNLPNDEDIATICYTSGTSGNPKGALLSHKNFIASLIGYLSAKDEYICMEISKNDVYLSYLPLAHVLERIVFLVLTNRAAKIVFYSGSLKTMKEDFKIVKPTIFVGVPRVFNVFANTIEKEFDKRPLLIKWLIKAAIKYKIKQQENGIYSNYVLDTLIFNKVKNEFGGRIGGILNGSAPLSDSTTKFLQAVLSTKIF
ncbi:hypothetical protein GVAV_000556 [Gurleya vavrai]